MLKDDIKKAIDNLPDDCSLEDIQYTLYVRQKIEKGLKDIENGDVVPHTEVEQRFSKWLNR